MDETVTTGGGCTLRRTRIAVEGVAVVAELAVVDNAITTMSGLAGGSACIRISV